MSLETQTLLLTPELVRRIQPSKGFKNNERPIVSLGYDDTGEFCVTSSQDESLNVYNCREGKHKETLYSKKYGVSLIRFTHGKDNTIYASTKEDDAIRYHSLHDNKYIRYFKGHSKQVVSLEMSPLNDQFLSASLDQTVRMWDLRSPDCQSVLPLSGRSMVAFDPSGLVFAVAINSCVLKLFDCKDSGNGPFATWEISGQNYTPGHIWTGIKFTNDGKHILISTVVGVHYLIDAFEGVVKKRLQGKAGLVPSSYGEEVSLSPDARFAFAGSESGNINVWDLHSRETVLHPMSLKNQGQNRVNIVSFNPAYAMLVTGGEDLIFWEPRHD